MWKLLPAELMSSCRLWLVGSLFVSANLGTGVEDLETDNTGGLYHAVRMKSKTTWTARLSACLG
jgi:hypothetical protein